MMPYETFAAIIRALALHGISGPNAAVIAHAIMDEFDETTSDAGRAL